MNLLFEGLKNGLAMGSIYALMALGYSMVYGIVKMINFAHSEFITIGGFVSYYLAEKILVPSMGKTVGTLLICLLISIIVCILIGVVTERFAYRPLRKKKSARINALITAIGVSYILGGLLNAINNKQMEMPKFFTNDVAFIVSIVTTAILLILLTIFVKKTKLGIAMRAVSENEDAAKLMGINNNFIVSLTFIIGSTLAAIGVIIYLLRSPFFDFTLGSESIGLYPFVAAVIGGIGSLPGAVIGGFLIGIIGEMTAVLGVGQWVQVIIYGIFVLILLFKPTGILGKDIREKV